MDSLFLAFAVISAIFNLGVLLLVIDNMRTMPVLGEDHSDLPLPKASILVPARNEADNIADCLQSLVDQKYPDFEILVFDDQSTDATPEILSAFTSRHTSIKALPSQPLAKGWMGKNWACHQLALAASGEILLFTDADTIHQPDALVSGVKLLQSRGGDMLSIVPKEQVITWSERLTIPILVWILAALLPNRIAWKIRLPMVSAAIGQYLMFTKEAYDQIGGYEMVREEVADDFALARRVKAEGLRGLLANGSDHVQCRMYQNWPAIVDGLGKNLFAVFEHRFLVYAFAWLWLVLTAWAPWLIILTALFGLSVAPFTVAVCLAAGIGSLISWGIILRRFRLPQYLSLFGPLIILNSVFLAGFSAFQYWSGRAVWKGRQLPRRGMP